MSKDFTLIQQKIKLNNHIIDVLGVEAEEVIENINQANDKKAVLSVIKELGNRFDIDDLKDIASAWSNIANEYK